MRLTDEDLECKSADTSLVMSVTSDTSSRDDCGSAPVKNELFWSDNRFNTLRGGSHGRDRSQDSQSSETGSMHSDSSGSAYLSGSYNNSGMWNTTNGVHARTNGIMAASSQSSPVHGQYSEQPRLSHGHTDPRFHNNHTAKTGPRINLSKSFDQSLLIHAIRKQKALDNYYELKENHTCDNNNYKGPHLMYRQMSLTDADPDYYPSRSEEYHQSHPESHNGSHRMSPEQSVTSDQQSRPKRPSHLVMSQWNSPVLPQSHPFYIPSVTNIAHRDPTARKMSYDEETDNVYTSDPGYNIANDGDQKTRAKEAFQTRALSVDFGRYKVPDFPCHRAALGEPIPTTPESANPRNGLNKPWPYSMPSTPSDGYSHKKSPMSSINSSDGLVGILKNANATSSPRKDVQVQRSATTVSKRKLDTTNHVRSSRLPRSSSAPNNLDQWTEDEDDDDEDTNHSMKDTDDDFGFKTHPVFKHVHADKLPNGNVSSPSHSSPQGSIQSDSSTSSPGMQKAKSPLTPRRILPKKWRKSKSVSNNSKHISLWRPEPVQGGCLWTCRNGRQLTLTPSSLLTLTESERLAVQKISYTKLQAFDLGCTIHTPKEWNSNKRSKKSTFSSLRKRTASTSALENKGKESGWVFGIPLAKCIANDLELRRRKPLQLQERRESVDLTSSQGGSQRQTRKSSTSSGGAVSSDSLSESDVRGQGSNLLEALSLSSSSQLDNGRVSTSDASPLSPHIPQVPYIVSTCCKHLETYGLRVLGIFRIGCSKKRAKQLREELDTGRDVKLNEEHNAHDVAGLLKEYFRDLPDPLLTKDLYSAFVASRKLRSEEARLQALQHLVCLLPAANRDTLWALLRFLNLVVQHSTDATDETGQLLPGNRMDSTNLGTLFGPNLLHKAKSGEFTVESLERAEERKDVIAVVKELIDKQSAIFQLSAELQDEMYRSLLDTNPEALDHILRRRSLATQGRTEQDAETSASSFYEDSECSSIPHSPGYSSETDSGCPRTLTEALAMGAMSSPPSGVPRSQLRQIAADSPSTPQRGHRPAVRVVSDDSQVESRKADISSKVPQTYRLSVPDQSSWYRGDRSLSPASPRISPSPKALKAEKPSDLRIRITTDSPERTKPGSEGHSTAQSPYVRRSVGVPHGPGPGGHRSKSHSNRNQLTVPTTCSRSKSTESCSSVGSSSTGYRGGSSRSGTNSPLTPEQSAALGQKWYLETPPDSPKDGNPSPLQRTSSTHRPLGFGVPKTNTPSPLSSSPSSTTLKNEDSSSAIQDSSKPASKSVGAATTSPHRQESKQHHKHYQLQSPVKHSTPKHSSTSHHTSPQHKASQLSTPQHQKSGMLQQQRTPQNQTKQSQSTPKYSLQRQHRLETEPRGSPKQPSHPHKSSSVTHTAKPSARRMEEEMDWQKERWKHWEQITRQSSEDFNEQETLV